MQNLNIIAIMKILAHQNWVRFPLSWHTTSDSCLALTVQISSLQHGIRSVFQTIIQICFISQICNLAKTRNCLFIFDLNICVIFFLCLNSSQVSHSCDLSIIKFVFLTVSRISAGFPMHCRHQLHQL